MMSSFSADAYRQHASIRAHAFFDVPGFDTPATRIGKALAERLDRHDWQAFRNSIFNAIMLVARGLRRNDHGLRIPDLAQAGHAFLVFSTDGGGSCGGIVALDELETARAARISMLAPERRERLLSLVKLAHARQEQMGDARSQEIAIAVAGLLVTLDKIEALDAVEDALPALVILTKRERGRRAVRSRTVVATLPGDWLGLRPAAGSA